MKVMSREDLLNKEELKIEKVILGPEDCVYVRQMTGREKDTFELSVTKEDKDGMLVRDLSDFRAKLAVNTLCDEAGNLLLAPDDYELLSRNMSSFRLEIIARAAQRLNQVSEADIQAMAKN